MEEVKAPVAPRRRASQLRRSARPSGGPISQARRQKFRRFKRAIEELAPALRESGELKLQFVAVLGKALRSEGLLEVLREPIRLASKRSASPPSSAIERLVADGTLIESATFAERMGWTRQALSKALAAKRVFCFEHGGARYFPVLYLDDSLDRGALHKVSKALGHLPPGAKLQFFETPKVSLGQRTPVEALKAGKLADVVTAAESYAHR